MNRVHVLVAVHVCHDTILEQHKTNNQTPTPAEIFSRLTTHTYLVLVHGENMLQFGTNV